MELVRKIKTMEKRERRGLLISAAVILAVVVLVIVVLSYAVQESVYRERKNSLTDTTVSSAATVNTSIRDDRKITEVLENIVSRDLSRSGSVERFIADAGDKLLTGNDLFFLVDQNGKYYSSDGKNGILPDLGYYASTTEDELEYISTLPHLDQNVTYLIMRSRLESPVTVWSGTGQITFRYCAMMFDLQELNDTVASLFPGANNTFIYESGTGAMLYKQFSLGLLIEGYNVYPKWSKGNLTFGETPEEMVEKCRNREICVAQLEIGGAGYYVCSAPLDVSDWSLMFVVQEEYINRSSGSSFQSIIYFIAIVIALLGAAVLVYIISVFRRRTRLEQEKNQSVVNALSEDFESVLYVPYREDKLTDEVIPYRRSEKIRYNFPYIEQEKYFSRLLDLFCENYVSAPDRDMFYKATRREVIKEKLAGHVAYYLNFRGVADGKEEYTQIQFSPVYDSKGRNTGFVAGIRDIDEETREKMVMQEKLQVALEEATYASKAKSAFLFNMSHDIRTPMNAILGFTNMAIRDIDMKDRVLDNLQKIRKSGDILLSLINDVLEMSRIENGKVAVSDNMMDVMKSFDSIIPVMGDLAAAKNITIDYRLENIEDRYVHLDATRVQRVLMNLISNSVKYTDNGGWVKVTGTQLPRKKDGCAVYRYTVEDNGIGMSEEFQKHLFEQFTREETDRNIGVQGTGLGLSLVKNLTELMGGTVSAVSTLGVGSRFTVDLPFRLQTEEEIRAAVSAEQKTAELNLNGRKVLVVEDNELNREIAQDILQEEGLEVTLAVNGADAVEKLKNNGPDAYDFILMDIQMPVMNGYEAAGEIRKLWPEKKIVIIALSANAFEEDRQRSRDSGMDDHIAKPIDIDELFRTIKKYIR